MLELTVLIAGGVLAMTTSFIICSIGIDRIATALEERNEIERGKG